jgi:hypothetical protein
MVTKEIEKEYKQEVFTNNKAKESEVIYENLINK